MDTVDDNVAVVFMKPIKWRVCVCTCMCRMTWCCVFGERDDLFFFDLFFLFYVFFFFFFFLKSIARNPDYELHACFKLFIYMYIHIYIYLIAVFK